MCKNAAIIKEGEIVRNDSVRNITALMPLEKVFLKILDDDTNTNSVH